MVVLGIETSCDETAAAVVESDKVLSNVVSSSVRLCEKYGGVIPEIASRFHVEYINHVAKKALRKAKKSLNDLDLVSVTDTPGLPGSLLTGISFAKALSYSLGIPLLNINHLHAHIYANFLVSKPPRVSFPFIGVVVSGGHTNIFICRSFKDFETIGSTVDDAIGEAFDKVAKILGIGYPGGPRVERYAKACRRDPGIKFPRAFLKKDSLDFSLSGIKTAVFYHVRGKRLSKRDISRISYAFQEAVFDVLVKKILSASCKHRIKKIFMGGGVISNKYLRLKLMASCRSFGCELFYPPMALCQDNAAMVAGLGEALFNYTR